MPRDERSKPLAKFIAHHGGRVGGLHSNFRVVREQLSDLSRGRKRIHGSRFAWDVSGALALLCSSRRGELPDPVGRDRRIEAVRATARLQVVKCSPLHQFAARSEPSRAMEAECPPRYLVKELQALTPSVLVCFGRAPRQALARLGATGLNEAKVVRRGPFTCANSVIDVIAVPHPSAFGAFKEARSKLRAELAERPAGTRGE